MTDVTALLAGIKERALAALDYPGHVTVEQSQADVPRLVAAIEAVAGLHTSRRHDPVRDGVVFGQGDAGEYDICAHDRANYPCPTITAVVTALGGGKKPFTGFPPTPRHKNKVG